jgi:putative spermidine/putrescine transport system permease protein
MGPMDESRRAAAGGRAPAAAPATPSSRAPHLDVAELERAEEIEHEAPREAALGEAAVERRRGGGWITAAWAAPGFAWLAFFLLAPLVFIVLVSFWKRTDFGFVRTWTLHNYGQLFHDSTYWHNMLSSFETSVIAVAACLVFGFPVAYFLALKVEKLQYQIGLFVLALAPFWTSFLTRSVAWTYPLMGREGALNQLLIKIGVISQPISEFGFTPLSVRLAMVQLYILFMVTPLFFMLAQVDRSALEAARDLGGNAFRTFREVILPQTMPGIVIGSIFIFVLTMGEYGTVQVIGGNTVQSVGTMVYTDINSIQYPQGAASAVLLVLALILGVFVITRFSNLREEI